MILYARSLRSNIGSEDETATICGSIDSKYQWPRYEKQAGKVANWSYRNYQSWNVLLRRFVHSFSTLLSLTEILIDVFEISNLFRLTTSESYSVLQDLIDWDLKVFFCRCFEKKFLIARLIAALNLKSLLLSWSSSRIHFRIYSRIHCVILNIDT